MKEEEEQDPFKRIKRELKQNIGTIIQIPERGEERIRFSPHQYPEDHTTVVEAAFWERDEATGASSKFKTLIIRGLENARGERSIITDGDFADSRQEAIEWIEEKASEYDGEDICWEDIPKKDFEIDD